MYLLFIPIFSFLFDSFLVFLNIKNMNKNKAHFEDLDNIFYIKEKSYFKLLSLFTRQLLFVILILFLLDDVIELLEMIFDNNTIVTLTSIFLLYSIIQLISTMYEYLDAFITEKKYGFNKYTVESFLKDQLVDYISTSIIIILSTFVVYLLYTNLGVIFIFYSLGFIILLLTLYNMLFVVLFIPLMFKQTPLEEGALKEKITKLVRRENLQIDQIVIINASKKTTKINAYFSGFGKQKKIMLFDTLLEKFTDEQLLAIIAHEIGHSKHHDMIIDLLVDSLLSVVYLSLFYFFLQSNLITNTNLFVVAVVYTLICVEFLHKLLKGVRNVSHRKHEKKADLYVKDIGLVEELKFVLQAASVTNKGNPFPHPLFVIFKYNHPSSTDRIKYLN